MNDGSSGHWHEAFASVLHASAVSSMYSGIWTGNGGSGEGTPAGASSDKSILAVYEWDECGRLVRSVSSGVTAYYVYGADGMRAAKHTAGEETLYFNRMWTWHGGGASPDQSSKHIYLGSERIATQMNSWKGQQTYSEEQSKTYYYHTDHLGSAQLITDSSGHEYQRTEYTPYGELWVDKIENPLYVYMPYKFNAKELDGETGLYYYGARYLDPMYSVWISPDPALGDYLPTAGADNSNLPGMGGVFNTTNCHLYNYAGNNPVRYVDPDGEWVRNNTDYYILIKTEKSGFVVLAPHSFYTGENVYRHSGIIDSGKIDGVIFSTGNILKVSDSEKISKIPLVGQFIGNTSVIINQYDVKNLFSDDVAGTLLLAYIPFGPESAIPNNIATLGKILTGRFDFSGSYVVRSLSKKGIWIDRAPTQEELKAMCNGKESAFYTEDELLNFMNQFMEEFYKKSNPFKNWEE